MTRILYISSSYPPEVEGGAEVVAASLAEAVRAAGHDVRVLTLAHTPRRDDGVDVRHADVWQAYEARDRAAQPRVRRALWHLVDLANPTGYRAVADELRERPVDLVHTHNVAGFSTLVWRAAAAAHVPVVHTAHDYYLACPRTTLRHPGGRPCRPLPWPCGIQRAVNFRRAGSLAVLASPSRYLLERHRRLGLRVRRWEVIANGVPSPAAATTPTEADRLRVVFIGQLSEHKGVEVLLAAMARLPADLPIELEIVGRGPLVAKVDAAARHDARVHPHGFAEGSAKERVYAAADLVVVPSVWEEVAPLVVAEAVMRGIPVLASDIGGLPDMVGRAGVLVPPGDSAALARELAALATNRAAIAALRQAAREERARFGLEQMVDGYLRLYDSVLSGERPLEAAG